MVNNHPVAHKIAILNHGEKYADIIMEYQRKQKKKYYKQKNIAKDIGLTQRQITIGSIWLKRHGYIEKFNGKNSPWIIKKWKRKRKLDVGDLWVN